MYSTGDGEKPESAGKIGRKAKCFRKEQAPADSLGNCKREFCLGGRRAFGENLQVKAIALQQSGKGAIGYQVDSRSLFRHAGDITDAFPSEPTADFLVRDQPPYIKRGSHGIYDLQAVRERNVGPAYISGATQYA